MQVNAVMLCAGVMPTRHDVIATYVDQPARVTIIATVAVLAGGPWLRFPFYPNKPCLLIIQG